VVGIWWGDTVTNANELCRRCGNEVYGFSKKMSASDGLYYCIKCAESIDKKHLIENTCSFCARTFIKGEVKFVAPSKTYGTSHMPLEKRLVCVGCYKRFATKSRARITNLLKSRLSLRHNFVASRLSVSFDRMGSRA
jgi:hypothetical protein